MEATNTNEEPVPVAAVLAKLKNNTRERNDANQTNHYLSNRITSLLETQFATFGRLVKYDANVFDEVLQYAEANNVMMKLDSHIVGEYSVIGDYTTKAGKTFKAHFTINGNYIRKLEKGETKQVSYPGYFPYKKYKHLFRIDRTKGTYKCFLDFITPI
jgi:hypothetical protein